MKRIMNSRLLVIIAATMAAALLSFAATGVAMGTNFATHSATADAQGAADPQMAQDAEMLLAEKGFVRVPTIEEASRMVGYRVARPAFIPEGFSDLSKIWVTENKPSRSRSVMQTWVSKDGSSHVMLVNDPVCRGIGGEPAEVAGIAGERAFFGTETGRTSPLLVLFWRDGDISYNLVGIMAGPLDESALNRMALSVTAE